MIRMTSSIKNFERSGPSFSPIAVEPATSATSTETILRSPVATAIPRVIAARGGRSAAAVGGDREVEEHVVLCG
jgi:hypothetical protein